MQPNQTPNTPVSPEQPVVPGGEQIQVPATPEVAPAAPQSAPSSVPQQQPVAVPTVPPPVVPGTPVVPAPATSAPSTTPSVAGDVDVIEKAWVDQANAVIEKTKDDPYMEEEAVESLQQDYLKKRYGHDVKKPDGK